MKRFFDLTLSVFGILVLSPLFFFLAIAIKLDSKGPVFYLQKRVGLHNEDFMLFKFRSMFVDSEKQGKLTIGNDDSRITRVGKIIRKYKLDELAQLINVMKGEMSLVGPRPEVREFVSLYSPEQMKVLSMKPGISDYASILYRNENDLLAQSEDPYAAYAGDIMPEKLSINLEYMNKNSLIFDIKVIFLTIVKIGS